MLDFKRMHFENVDFIKFEMATFLSAIIYFHMAVIL